MLLLKTKNCLYSSCADFDDPAIYQLIKPIDHAEEPTWDGRKNMLYYVDMIAGGIYSYNYNTTEVHSIHLGEPVGPVIPSEHDENLLVIGLNRAVLALEWDGINEIGEQKVYNNKTKIYKITTRKPVNNSN